MTALALRVDSAGFEAASAVLGRDVAQSLAADSSRLVAALDGCGGMAGSDPAGTDWGSSYDAAVGDLLRVAQDAVNSGFRLAGLLQQSGFNYGLAESASVPGGAVSESADVTPWASQTARLARPPSAVGGGSDLPDGWGLISGFIDAVWPNGHQDLLHSAASAWRSFAGDLRARAYDVTRAYADIDAQLVPEAPLAHDRCALVAQQLDAIASHADSLAAGCEEYAHHLDEAHSAAIDELESFVKWTIGIEASGGILAFLTFGLSEVAAQAAEAAKASATAARIASIVARLQTLARDAAFALERLGPQLALAGEALRPLVTADIRVAQADRAAGRMTMAARARKGAGGMVDVETRLAKLPEALRVDLARVMPELREDVVATLERIAKDVKKFPGRDGKKFVNRRGGLPIGGAYKEWVIATRRSPHRLILEGPETSPNAVYYWDHEGLYVLIGPR